MSGETESYKDFDKNSKEHVLGIMDKKSNMSWHIGNAYGLLNGISLRPDVPEDVREICKQAVKKYKKDSDSWGRRK